MCSTSQYIPQGEVCLSQQYQEVLPGKKYKYSSLVIALGSLSLGKPSICDVPFNPYVQENLPESVF